MSQEILYIILFRIFFIKKNIKIFMEHEPSTFLFLLLLILSRLNYFLKLFLFILHVVFLIRKIQERNIFHHTN